MPPAYGENGIIRGMQQGWHYATPGQEQRTAQQQLPLGPETQEIALLSDLGNFSPGKSQAGVVPRLDHSRDPGRQRCPTDQHQELSAGTSGGFCLPVTDHSKPCLRRAVESSISLPSHILPQSKGTGEPTDQVTQAWTGMEQHRALGDLQRAGAGDTAS